MKSILLPVLMFILFITPCSFAANGNVYENQQYKFRMTVPDDWNIDPQKEPIVKIHPQQRLPELTIRGFPTKGTIIHSDTTIQDLNNKLATPIIEAMKKDIPTMVLVSKHYLKISNHDAVKALLRDEKDYGIFYFFFNKDYVFVISIAGFRKDLDIDQEAFNQIISTFEFID